MTQKELIGLLKDAYDTGVCYGRYDTEEFEDDEKLDANSWESFIERNKSHLTTFVPDTERCG